LEERGTTNAHCGFFLPFDIETNLKTSLSYNYHVAIHFKKPNQNFIWSDILTMTQERIKKMNIAVRQNIAEPLTIFCNNNLPRQGFWKKEAEETHNAVFSFLSI
jgi:hypothetical protein